MLIVTVFIFLRGKETFFFFFFCADTIVNRVLTRVNVPLAAGRQVCLFSQSIFEKLCLARCWWALWRGRLACPVF